jgi:hypothetical protein
LEGIVSAKVLEPAPPLLAFVRRAAVLQFRGIARKKTSTGRLPCHRFGLGRQEKPT